MIVEQSIVYEIKLAFNPMFFNTNWVLYDEATGRVKGGGYYHEDYQRCLFWSMSSLYFVRL